MSAIRKNAAEALRASASASVTAATASKGDAFSAASRTELQCLREAAAHSHVRHATP